MASILNCRRDNTKPFWLNLIHLPWNSLVEFPHVFGWVYLNLSQRVSLNNIFISPPQNVTINLNHISCFSTVVPLGLDILFLHCCVEDSAADGRVGLRLAEVWTEHRSEFQDQLPSHQLCYSSVPQHPGLSFSTMTKDIRRAWVSSAKLSSQWNCDVYMIIFYNSKALHPRIFGSENSEE